MATQAPEKTGLEKWQDGINNAIGDGRWNAWDCEIQTAVNEYNRHLSGAAGYVSLDWQLVKAMVWVETGANHAEWKVKPMQIGVGGDPGMTSLLSGKEGGDLILPPAWKGRLTAASVRTRPAHNLRAGIGYLLMRMANFDHQAVPGLNAKVYEITVKPGDSLDRLAKTHGSTVQTLKKLNPTATILRPGQVLKCQSASAQHVITGWRHITTTAVAQRYNGGGDPNYAKKLDTALSIVRTGKALSCEQ